jgi:propionyl-CoA synthetase
LGDPFERVLDDSRPPFARWFVGGRTNICHNAIDRHLAARADQRALVYVSTETDTERTYTYRELHDEVTRMAATLQGLGVQRGDRVLIYMPMIPEAMFAMLACTRIGAVHSVVFGGFASVSLAARIDDAKPRVIVSADAGSRAGKVVPYKPLLDEAIRLAGHHPEKVLLVDRKLAEMPLVSGRDEDYAAWRDKVAGQAVPCVWMESSEPSYVLYTSGTTGKPKGVQRDTGGYAVALATSMENIFCGKPGDTMFTASDIGWVVGHSYIVYGPLLAGMTTVMYEGTPIRPDGAILWKIVEQYGVNIMFSAHGDPCTQEAGPGAAHASRPVQPAAVVSGGRATGRTYRALDSGRHRQARGRQLLADRIGLADHRDPARRGSAATQTGISRGAGLRLRPAHRR